MCIRDSFYEVRIYHAPTSTVPAFNVQISDTLASELSYISGSWEANNSPLALAATGIYTVELPDLQAYFPMIATSIGAANPLILRYQSVVEIDVTPGTIITNVADVQWTSLFTDVHGQGEVRNGSGGVNDYQGEDTAQVSLDEFTIVKSGPLTVTDCNVMVGKLDPELFPQVFGAGGDLPLDADVVRRKFAALAAEVGARTGTARAPEAVAEGFLKIAVENMANAIKHISVQRGYDVTEYTLCCFGGAGGQHACLVADALGMTRVLLHPCLLYTSPSPRD